MEAISVVIPALNEEQGIRAVIQRVREVLPHAEVVIVDDGSTDKTGDIAREEGATVLRHPAKGGYGQSLKDGISIAKHDVIAIIDADGTYAPSDISPLLEKMGEGYDMVVGARHGKHYRGTFLKMPARWFFKLLVEFTTGTRIPDVNSGLRLFRKSTVTPYFPTLCRGFSFTTTITLAYLLTGRYVMYMPVSYGKREGKSKVRIVSDSLRTLQFIIESVAYYNPLKMFLILAFVPLFFSVVCVVWMLATWSMWLFVPLIVLLCCMLLLLGIGIAVHAIVRHKDVPASRLPS